MIHHRLKISTISLIRLIGLMLLITIATAPLLAEEPAQQTVSLAIDFNDGSQLHFTNLAWNDKMTVLDALAAAAAHKRGVKYQVRGSGSFAFVTAIDGQAAEAGNGRNWIFKVNGKLAKMGAGARKLKAGDRVEWLFSRYQDQ